MSLSKITKSAAATGKGNGVKAIRLTSSRGSKWTSSPIYNQISMYGALLKRARKNSKNRGKATVKDIPEEIWVMIIGYLTDSQDWLNFSRTCGYFQDLMEKNKAASLLPGVVKILIYGAGEGGTKLSGEDIKNLRLLSKSWNKLVTFHLSHHPCNLDLSFRREDIGYDYPRSMAPSLPMVFAMMDVDWVKDFRKMKEIVRNVESDQSVVPFSRHLILDGVSYHWKGEENRETVLSFVKKVGSSIWHFGLTIYEYGNYGIDEYFYETLVKILQMLPNLRSLRICLEIFDDEFPSEEELTAKYKIPHFPYLQVLEFRSVPEFLCKRLLLSNNHVQKLGLIDCHVFECDDYLTEYFFNSAEIVESVKNIEEFSFETTFYDMETLIPTLQSVNWPLTKVDILCVDWEIPAEILFQSLERFGGTLTHLSARHVEVAENWSIQFETGFPKLRFMWLRLKYRSHRRKDFVTEEIKQMVIETLKCSKDVKIKITDYY